MRFLASRPDTWPAAIVPALLFAVLATAGTFVGIAWVTEWVLSWFGLSTTEGFWLTAAEWAVRTVMYIGSVLVGVWIALLLAPPLSAPALEHLVSRKEHELGVPARSPLGFIQEFYCGLRSQLLAVVFALPIVLALWLLELLIPPLAVVTIPLRILITAMAVAWNLFDYPLTLRSVGMNDRLRFVVGHWQACLGFGLAFSAIFWVPCFGVLMLPVGVVAATQLLYRLLSADSQQLPELPRPGTSFDNPGAAHAEHTYRS